MLVMRIHELFCWLFIVTVVTAQTLKSTISVTILPPTVASSEGGRMYVSPRSDSSADILWSSAPDHYAVWTRLNMAGQRRVPDIKLDDNDLVFASGLVALPGDVIAVVRNSKSGGEKHLTEFDSNGKILRTTAVASGDDRWTPRVLEFMFGFNKGRKTMEYTLWGETTGGGHYGSRSSTVDYKWFERNGWGGGCSHSLANRGDFSHTEQAPGMWCLQDGFGGIYQWLTKNVNTYKFRFDYGYPTLPLGDVVSYMDGFFVSFAAPQGNHFDAWGSSTTVRTDVGVIFVKYSNTMSAPRDVTWITTTADKTESRVHLTLWGPPSQNKLLLFWLETDTVKPTIQSVSTYYVAEMNIVADNKGFHVEEVKREVITDVVKWEELQTFTSFPNGDVAWAIQDDTGSLGIKFTRMKYPHDVDGGWTEWGPCDCDTKEKKRACSNPVQINNGQACMGEKKMACTTTEECISFATTTLESYPKGLNPATQDPSGGLWVEFAKAGGMPKCVPPIEAAEECKSSPKCCGAELVCCERDNNFAMCVPSQNCSQEVLGTDWTSNILPEFKGDWETVNANNVFGKATKGVSTDTIKYMGLFDSLEGCQIEARKQIDVGTTITAITWHTPQIDPNWAKSCYATLNTWWEPVPNGGEVLASRFNAPCNICNPDDIPCSNCDNNNDDENNSNGTSATSDNNNDDKNINDPNGTCITCDNSDDDKNNPDDPLESVAITQYRSLLSVNIITLFFMIK